MTTSHVSSTLPCAIDAFPYNSPGTFSSLQMRTPERTQVICPGLHR